MGTDRDTGKFGFKFLHARFPLPVNYPFSRINLPLPRRPRDKPEIPLEPYIDTIQVVQVPSHPSPQQFVQFPSAVVKGWVKLQNLTAFFFG